MESVIQVKIANKLFEGTITYEEGDLVEASFSEELDVSVGDPLQCMITRNLSEITSFQGITLAKEPHRLIIFNPPSVLEFKEQRRRYPRFDIKIPGWIRVLVPGGAKMGISDPKVEVVNVSLGGVAFRFDQKLAPKTNLTFYTELYGRDEGVIQSRLEVIHINEEDGFVHGCKVVDMTSKSLHELRKYLLQRQLDDLKRK